MNDSKTTSVTTSVTNKKMSPMLMVLIAILLTALVVGGAMYLYLSSMYNAANTKTEVTTTDGTETDDASTDTDTTANPAPTPTPTPPTATEDETADWGTYTGQGFTFKYPSDWIKTKDVVRKNMNDQQGCLVPNDCAMVSAGLIDNTEPTQTALEVAQMNFDPAIFEEITIRTDLVGVKVKENGTPLGRVNNMEAFIVKTDYDEFLIIQVDTDNMTKYLPIFEQILPTFKINL